MACTTPDIGVSISDGDKTTHCVQSREIRSGSSDSIDDAMVPRLVFRRVGGRLMILHCGPDVECIGRRISMVSQHATAHGVPLPIWSDRHDRHVTS